PVFDAGANQPPPFEGRNLYLIDPALQDAVAREGAAWARERLVAWGETLGSADTLAIASRANRYIPELRSHDRLGNRLDEVAIHPGGAKNLSAHRHGYDRASGRVRCSRQHDAC